MGSSLAKAFHKIVENAGEIVDLSCRISGVKEGDPGPGGESSAHRRGRGGGEANAVKFKMAGPNVPRTGG